MNDISWAEVVGSVRPLIIAAGLFVALVVVAIIRTRKNRRRLVDKASTQTR